MDNKTNDKTVKESIVIRGICAAVQNMWLPTIESVNKLLKPFGYIIKNL